MVKMPRAEKEIESCIKTVNILVYIIVWILFIECIIELSKNNDNLFFPIFTIIMAIFLICCLSMSFFLQVFIKYEMYYF